MYSDQGAEFRNKILQGIAKKYKFDHKTFSVYHPQSNGLTERKNSSILTALRCFQDLDEWDDCLGTAQLAVNAAYTSSLGDSPFFVLKGKDPELPYTRFTKPSFSYSEDESDQRLRRDHFVMETVKQKLLEAADRNCRQRLKCCKERELK